MKRIRRAAVLVVGLVLLVAVSALGPAAMAASGGGTFRHAFTDNVVTLDPAVTHTNMDWEIIFQIYEPLIQYKGSSLTELEPILATTVPTLENGLISPDGLSYTFPIRQGVLFHDGTELTAEDVVYTFNRILTMDIPQAKAQQHLMPHLRAVEARDRYTVTFHLKAKNPGFLFALADPSAVVVSKAYVEAHGGVVAGQENEWMRWNACGTGPFQLDQVVDGGRRIVLTRNETYWAEKPSIERIETVVVADASTAALMMQRGEIDSMELDRGQLKNVQGMRGVVIEEGLPSLRSHTIRFQANLDTSKIDPANTIPADFFADPNVRKGFAHAFPYEDYIRVYRPGDARYAGPIPNGVLGSSPDTPMYGYDPEKAAEYFKQTRWWDEGFTVTMYTLPDWDMWPQAILMLAESLKQINPKFDIQMRSVEWATLVSMLNERAVPIQMAALRGVTPDPDSFIRNRMYKGGWDLTGLDDPEVNRLIERAATTLDPNERARMYEELERIAYDTAFMLWISQDSGYMVHRDRVRGLYWHPIFQTWLSWKSISLDG